MSSPYTSPSSSSSSMFYPPHPPYPTYNPGPAGPSPYPYPQQYAAMSGVGPHASSPRTANVPRSTAGIYPAQSYTHQQLHVAAYPPPKYQHPPQYHQYTQPYTPSSPTAAGSYPHGSTNYPLSPLPKQLSMPSPRQEAQPAPFVPQSTSPPPQPKNHKRHLVPYAIWSRRPTDPSHAPGIIISPLAHPPLDVLNEVAVALDLPTPPASPVQIPIKIQEEKLEAEAQPEQDPAPSPPLENSPAPTTDASLPSSVATSRTASSTTTHTPTPSSPLSSATSVSQTQTKAIASPASSSSELKPSTPTPPPKKLWASLLRTPASGSNGLPTSDVVGISIPASSSSSSTTPTTYPPSLRAHLLPLLTGQSTPKVSSPARKIKVRGLINTGNMCFANAVLQVLVYCEPFRKLFGEGGLGGVSGRYEGAVKTPLVDATVRFLRELGGDVEGKGKGRMTMADGNEGMEDGREGDEAFVPWYVYDAMKEKKRFDTMRGGHQEDAEEFLGFYLDALEEELLALLAALSDGGFPSQKSASKSPPVEEREEEASKSQDGWYEVGKRNRSVVTRTIKTAESPISRIFGGKFKSTLRAPGQKDSVIVEDWSSLRLDIQRESITTLKDALLNISAPQSVSITSLSSPIQIEAHQQTLIDALPPILVLHVKRFLYDTSVKGVVKLAKHIPFTEDLEIVSQVLTPAARKGPATSYRLFGVLYHHGQTASGGHYTLDVLHPSRAWVRIDDEVVTDIKAEEVFGSGGGDENGRCAYLLFYRRIR